MHPRLYRLIKVPSHLVGEGQGEGVLNLIIEVADPWDAQNAIRTSLQKGTTS